MSLKYKLDEIAQAATQALLYEVSVTPKPGLVDRNNSGAHSDMDFFTFMASASSLAPYFNKMVERGYHWEGSLNDLFLELRNIGMDAERSMFKATCNVNTHKGLIFSLGIICGATGYYYKKEGIIETEQILSLCGEMTQEIIKEEFDEISHKEAVTKGESLYKVYGIKGIRGEVAKGFPNVRNLALPYLKGLKKVKISKNEKYLQVLLLLMAQVEDTNVLARHNIYMLKFVAQQVELVLSKGGALTKEGMQAIVELDKTFIELHISPGGCADLLAVTIMMDLLEGMSY